MKALVKTNPGPGNVELKDVPTPEPGPGEVLVKVAAAGVCGSDVHILHDTFVNRPPVILGHEFAGEVVEVSPDVRAFAPGDRVVVEPHNRSCGWCKACRAGLAHLCPSKESYGYISDGGFAEYAAASANLCHLVPDSLSMEEAALAEPAAVVLTALAGRVMPGDSTAVVGAGPIGLLALQVARAHGAAYVEVRGTARDRTIRFPVARFLGADAIIDADAPNGRESVAGGLPEAAGAGSTVEASPGSHLERTQMCTEARVADPRRGNRSTKAMAAPATIAPSRAIDVAVEASGSRGGALSALRCVRVAGTVVAIGLTGRKEVGIPWDEAVMKSVRLLFSYSSSYESWEAALRLIATGQLRVKPLITHIFPLEDWEKAFVLAERGEAIKALLKPGRGRA